MDLTSRGKQEVSPHPDPAPHRPSRFRVPPGAVDTHAHVVGVRAAMAEDPDDRLRRSILTTNAQRLYGFTEQ